MLGNPTPSYDPDKFITRARQPELERISHSVKQSLRGERIEWPVVNFWGVTGIGKSWLLQHVNYLYQPDPYKQQKTIVLLYKFENNESAKLTTLARKLASSLKAQLPPELKSNEEMQRALQQASQGNHHALIHALDACTAHKLTPIILFDDTEIVNAEAWEQIEKELMEPLVLNGRILFVIAGRRYIPRWRRFEVRRRVQEPHETHLAPFSKESVKRLLEKRNYNIDADILLPLTAGNPRLIYELGSELQEMSRGETVNQAFIKQHNEPIALILERYQQDLLKNIPEELYPYLCAIIPLRAYRMEALRFMLNEASKEDAYQEWTDGDYLRILRNLDQTEIVWWNRDRRAYTTDYIARRIINQRQLLADPEVFIQWHQRAVSLYLQWAAEYPTTSEDFILEAWFHLANIWQAKPQDDTIIQQFSETLDIAKQLTTDRKLVIQEQLDPHDKDTEYDNELYDLLPGDWQRQARTIWTEMIKQPVIN